MLSERNDTAIVTRISTAGAVQVNHNTREFAHVPER